RQEPCRHRPLQAAQLLPRPDHLRRQPFLLGQPARRQAHLRLLRQG
ncbi:hypothetical protein KTAU_37720, partial [Thermogemmatispora aurantia]